MQGDVLTRERQSINKNVKEEHKKQTGSISGLGFSHCDLIWFSTITHSNLGRI